MPTIYQNMQFLHDYQQGRRIQQVFFGRDHFIYQHVSNTARLAVYWWIIWTLPSVYQFLIGNPVLLLQNLLLQPVICIYLLLIHQVFSEFYKKYLNLPHKKQGLAKKNNHFKLEYSTQEQDFQIICHLNISTNYFDEVQSFKIEGIV